MRPEFPRIIEFVERDPHADVLVVTNMWPDAGRPVYGIFVRRQVESMRAHGVRCDVLYLRGYLSSLAYPLAALRFLWASVRWRKRYRLVHVHAGEAALAARFYVGPPMLVSYCGDDVLGDPRDDGSVPAIGRARAAVQRAQAALFPATITKSQEMHDRLPARVQRRNIVLPNGVDTALFSPVDRAEARRRLGWDAEERVALFAATKPDIPRKRRKLAEQACAEAASSIGPVRLHVAGLTSPDEMPLLMSAADCLLHTASVEGSPNVVKEALMCNLPVVATPSGDLRNLLDGVVPSYICPPDVAALGAALAVCLGDPVRSNGRAQIETSLSSDAVAGRLLEIYERLAGPSRRVEAAITSD
jgi:glycosyltransferase involved in cell wall biosynthesis